MPPTDPLSPELNLAITLLVLCVLLGLGVRAALRALPFRLPLVPLLWLGAVACVAAMAFELAQEQPRALLGGWLGVGLPVYLVRSYYALAEERAERARRLEQARTHERKRAPIPLPSGGPTSPATPTAGTTRTP